MSEAHWIVTYPAYLQDIRNIKVVKYTMQKFDWKLIEREHWGMRHLLRDIPLPHESIGPGERGLVPTIGRVPRRLGEGQMERAFP